VDSIYGYVVMVVNSTYGMDSKGAI